MSLKALPIPPIPEETVRVARAAFPLLKKSPSTDLGKRLPCQSERLEFHVIA
jgi:hypothetical protein